MQSPLDDLLTISKRWTLLPRTADVVLAAVSFLRTSFHITAGFVSYRRPPMPDGRDYLDSPKVAFISWGMETRDRELQIAVDESRELIEQLEHRHWYTPEQVPATWTKINRSNHIAEVGIWLINFRQQAVGALVLARKEHEAWGNREEIARCMDHIVVVIELVVMRRISEELSIRDPLTRTFNRRGLFLELEKSLRQEIPLALAVVDLDGFKRFNDHHGHLAGDQLLIQVADILHRNVQGRQGICARTGGDEFLIAFRCDTRDIGQAAEMVSNWLLEEGIQASVGCSSLMGTVEKFDACYREADVRLYVMKAAKRFRPRRRGTIEIEEVELQD